MDRPTEEVLWSLKKKDSGKVYSQIPFSKIKAWILEARIDAQDSLTNPQLKQWVSASSLKELAPFFAPESMGSEAISREDTDFPWARPTEDDVSIDMTPMIDVTFQLLIFFMLTATFSIHQVKKVSLPESTTTVTSKPEKISVVVEQQKITIFTPGGEKNIDRDRDPKLLQFKKILEEEVTRTQQQDILVAGEKTVQYEFIILVLDIVTKSGIKNINLQLQKKK